MAFAIKHKPSFYEGLWKLPKAVQKRLVQVVEHIAADPFRAGGHAERCFKHRYQNTYRYRLGDYRLVYAVGNDVVNLLAIDTRGAIYERFHADPDDLDPPSIDAASAEPVPFQATPYDPAPSRPTPEPHPLSPLSHSSQPSRPKEGYAGNEVLATNAGPGKPRAPDAPSVASLLRELLVLWGVPPDKHDAVLACRTLEELIDLGLPDEVTDRVFSIQRPATVEQIAAQPNYRLDHPGDLERYIEGSLSRFLLDLDPEQERVASRSLRGPTLLQGGPGTGKSLVALYRIRNLLTPSAQERLFGGGPPSILLVTFGRTLIRACEQLLDELLPTTSAASRDGVTVTTLDALVRRILVRFGEPHDPVHGARRQAFLKTAIMSVQLPAHLSGTLTTIRALRPEYVLDEFDWVIEGRNLTNVAEYLKEDRAGRGIRLDQRQREALWAVHEKYVRLLEAEGLGTFNLYRRRALELVLAHPESAPESEPAGVRRYDVVIVDEAQDLPPVGLSLCAELCRDPSGLFFTADPAQSIYSRGLSWSRVHEALRFRGRATVLRRNYRSTRQIAEAARQILSGRAGREGLDEQSFVTEPVRDGPRPVLFACRDLDGQARAAAGFLKEAATGLRMPVWYGAVLVPTNSVAERFAERLRQLGIPARAVRTDDFDLSERVIKVMTIHAAKGLEFPFVVVAALDRNYIPKVWDVADPEERQAIVDDERKLLFVAFSRAMRCLAGAFTYSSPSPYIAELDPILWERRSA